MTTNQTNPAPAASLDAGGLGSVPQVIELADKLSAAADLLHERIMREIRAYHGGAIPQARQDAARALLDDEMLLRQRANALYADAATYIVRSLGKSQQHVIALTVAAAEKIRTIDHIADGVSLVARLLGIAAAAATGQAAPIVLSLEALKHQLDYMALKEAAAKAAAAGATPATGKAATATTAQAGDANGVPGTGEVPPAAAT
jgi:hypothetical protein